MADQEFVTVARVGDIKPGFVKVVDAGTRRVALCNVDGEYYAIDDLCTHDGGPLGSGELSDNEIECPRHGARFDVRTGAVLCFPAVVPVPTYPVKVEDGEIKVGLPAQTAPVR